MREICKNGLYQLNKILNGSKLVIAEKERCSLGINNLLYLFLSLLLLVCGSLVLSLHVVVVSGLYSPHNLQFGFAQIKTILFIAAFLITLELQF